MPRIPAAELEAAVSAVIVPGTTYYVGLNSGDPGSTGANEFTGGGYARQAVVFAAGAVDGAVASNAAQTVPNAGTVPATHYSIWTAATGGSYKIGGALASSVTAASIGLAAGALVVAGA